MFDTITFPSLVTFKCMLVCPTRCPCPGTHLCRAATPWPPCRPSTGPWCPAWRCPGTACGRFCQHSPRRSSWSSSSLTSGSWCVPLLTAAPPLQTGYLKVGFNQERKCAWLSLVSLNRWTGHGGESGLELSMKCRSSFHSIQRVSEPQLKAPMSMSEESITQTLGYGESTFNWNTNWQFGQRRY